MGGVCWIAEVRSRFDGSKGVASVESFLAACEELGFKRKGKPDESNKMSVSYTHLTLPTICSV